MIDNSPDGAHQSRGKRSLFYLRWKSLTYTLMITVIIVNHLALFSQRCAAFVNDSAPSLNLRWKFEILFGECIRDWSNWVGLIFLVWPFWFALIVLTPLLKAIQVSINPKSTDFGLYLATLAMVIAHLVQFCWLYLIFG